MFANSHFSRFWLAFALLAACSLLLANRRHDAHFAFPDMAEFPTSVGSWNGQDVAIPSEIRQILGPGQYLSRYYTKASKKLQIDLFIAYLPSQRTGATIHSPKNCLPGSGWTAIEVGKIRISEANGKQVEVNRYIVARGEERRLVLYWYQAHSRVVSSEYAAKFYLVADSIRMNRTDGALVRIITPITQSEGTAMAEQRAVGFAQRILPLLDRYIPS